MNESPEKPDDEEVARQLRKPENELGKRVAAKMNETNAYLYNVCEEMLGVEVADNVLEIGFGNGEFLGRWAELANIGFVAGIDYSETMVEEAMERNSLYIANGRIEVVLGRSDELPFESGFFDKVVTLNTLYFWEEPLKDLKEIHRVLKEGGRFVMGIRTRKTLEKKAFAQHGFTLYSIEEAELLMTDAGFRGIHYRYGPDKTEGFDALCLCGEK
jgi:ubiquinone/menaquinone biosynthesis C-methylase UbiE